MNPILSQNKHVQEISRIIFEPLFERDEEYKLQKCLVTDWAKTSENTYLIKIRNDIKWSDGSQLVIEDVIFTIEKLKQVQSIYTRNVQNITNVEKIEDDRYMKIKLLEKYVVLLYTYISFRKWWFFYEE